MKSTLIVLGAGILAGIAGALVWPRVVAPAAAPATAESVAAQPAPRDRDGARILALERDRDQWRAEALRLAQSEPPAAAGVPAAPLVAPAPGMAPVPEAVRREFLRAWLQPEGTNRWQALARIGIAVTGDDFRELMREALGSSPSRNYGQWSRILSEWVQMDPKGAAEWSKHFVDPVMAASAMSLVASAIARADPAYTVDWLRGLPEGNARDMAVQNAAYPIAGFDPKLALGLLALVSNENSRANAASTVIAQLANKDAETAKAWVTSLPAGLVRDRGLQQLCYMTAPRKALEAFALAAQVGDENNRLQLTAYIAGQWARQDPAAASEWMLAYPAGHWRDVTVQSFALNLVSKDPAAAAEWAESIEDATVRNATMQGVGAQWLQKDRAAAAKWIEGSSMPASSREQLKAIQSGP